MGHTAKTRATALAKMKQRRSDWLEENGPCVICGSAENLEVDHIDSSTKVSHKVWSWSDEKRNNELAKCQVLCQKHHYEKTALDRFQKVKHGTETMYNHYKCRCAECRVYRSEYKKAYRDKRKALGLPRY